MKKYKCILKKYESSIVKNTIVKKEFKPLIRSIDYSASVSAINLCINNEALLPEYYNIFNPYDTYLPTVSNADFGFCSYGSAKIFFLNVFLNNIFLIKTNLVKMLLLKAVIIPIMQQKCSLKKNILLSNNYKIFFFGKYNLIKKWLFQKSYKKKKKSLLVQTIHNL